MLTAAHVGAGNIALDGATVRLRAGHRRAARQRRRPATYADLLMFQIYPEPPLPALAIASAVAAAAHDAADPRRSRPRPRAGDSRSQAPAAGSDRRLRVGIRAAAMRWGTNAVDGLPFVLCFAPENTYTMAFADRLRRTRSTQTGTNAQAAVGDSGGATFASNGTRGSWPGSCSRSERTANQPGETALYGNATVQRRSLVLPRPDPRRDGDARAERGSVAGCRGRGAARAPAPRAASRRASRARARADRPRCAAAPVARATSRAISEADPPAAARARIAASTSSESAAAARAGAPSTTSVTSPRAPAAKRSASASSVSRASSSCSFVSSRATQARRAPSASASSRSVAREPARGLEEHQRLGAVAQRREQRLALAGLARREADERERRRSRAPTRPARRAPPTAPAPRTRRDPPRARRARAARPDRRRAACPHR